MTVMSVQKDPETLTMTITAEFDAPLERVWQMWEHSSKQADPRDRGNITVSIKHSPKWNQFAVTEPNRYRISTGEYRLHSKGGQHQTSGAAPQVFTNAITSSTPLATREGLLINTGAPSDRLGVADGLLLRERFD